MKRYLLFIVVAGLLAGWSTLTHAADPADRFLDAYFLIQEGDAAEKQSDAAKAQAKYTAALAILNEIQKADPSWNPHIIEYRQKYCNDHLAKLGGTAPAPVPPTETTPAPTPPVPPTPPTPAETEQMQQMTAELQRAQEQIKQLEATRTELNQKLQDALKAMAPGQTNERIEALLKENKDLTAQIATMQTEMARLREPAPAPGTPAEASELVKLRAELTQARAELAQSKEQLASVRKDLELVRSENTELRQKYDTVVAQLTDANNKLRAAQETSAKDDEIIQQLRKENALLRTVADRKSIGSRSTAAAKGPRIPELKGWRPRGWQKAEEDKLVAPAKTITPKTESAPGKLVADVASPSKQPPKTEVKPAPVEKPAAFQSSPEVRALLNEAGADFARKDYDAAAGKYTQVLAQEPNNALAMSNLGVIHYQQGKLDEAEKSLAKAIELQPNDSNAHSVLGVTYLRKGKLDDAFNELTKAVALDPRNAEAHNYLGVVMSERGFGAAAEQEIRKAVELNDKYADAHFNLAVLYAKQKAPRFELARFHYKKAVDLGAAPDKTLEELLNKGK